MVVIVVVIVVVACSTRGVADVGIFHDIHVVFVAVVAVAGFVVDGVVSCYDFYKHQ